MKKFLRKLPLNCMAALALMVTAVSVNQACFYIVHQPEVPEAAMKLKRH